MTVELQNGVIIKINEENTIGTITESPNARDNVFIPRFVDHKGKKVPIKILSSRSFLDNEYIQSISFSEDSELETIQKAAFSHSTLQKLTIPEKVTKIEDGFCIGAKNLTEVCLSKNNETFEMINNDFLVNKKDKNLVFARRNIESALIPSSVKKISPYSFDSCKNLKCIKFEDSTVDELCNLAFNECTNLTEIKIPSSVVRIGERCFNACEKLKTVEIPADSRLKRIEKLAFFHSNVEALSIPETTEELVEGFCGGTASLNSIEVAKNNKKYHSFNGDYLTTRDEKNGSELIFVKRNVESFSIPSTVRKIGRYAFQNCHNLSSVSFSDSPSNLFIDEIDDHSFSECKKLEMIEIPTSLIKRIGKFAFNSCKNLKKVTFLPPTNQEKSILEIIDEDAFKGCENLVEISIPSCVKSIGSSCFHTCSNLKKINFANSEESKLESIGNYSFSYCLNLESIEIPKSVTFIGEFAFESCSNLRSVKFDKSCQLTTISKSTFSYCSSIEEFILPISVKTVGQGAFKLCTKLRTVTLLNSKLEEIGIEAFDGCSSLDKFEAPQSLRVIHGSSFRSCTSLSSIVFAQNSCLELIGKSAFNNCTALNKFEVPNGVKRIGQSAFDSCQNLQEVIINENSELQFIGAFAFSNTKIKSIFIPSKVSQIDEGFGFNASQLNIVDISNSNNCYSLASGNDFIIKKDEENVLIFARKDINNDVVFIPDDVKRIGKYAFSNCSLMKKISFYSNDKKCSIEVIDDFAFVKCSSITNVEIPNTVKRIGISSFASCTNLKTVTFEEPTIVEELEFNSFEDCPNLEHFEQPSTLRRISKNISDFFNINPT